jgi:hypothetical protein
MHPYFRDALKSNDNCRSSSQSIFVEEPPPHHHPTHKDSDSLFFPSNVLITQTRMLPPVIEFIQIRDKRYPSVPISGCENTLSFPSEETSLGRRGFPHISLREMCHAPPALLTVFSTTQLGHSITQLVFMRSRIWKCFLLRDLSGEAY